jgi:predicted dehydrogenase/flavin reductase (DIM6/NTAB) family NADH-FMN oxidoreductase RutF
MRRPAATIWDTKIQVVCGVVAAQEGADVELWMCGNFGQVSLSEPHIAVNPNRLYPIEPAIRRGRRFSISVFSAGQRDAALRLARVRRRAVHKAKVTGIRIETDAKHRIPYAPDCFRILFCEAEQILDTGDHTLVIARVLENRVSRLEGPLLYREIAGNPAAFPALEKAVRWALTTTGAKERIQQYLQKRRGGSTVDLREATYQDGGQTDREVEQIAGWGLRDEGRILTPPERAPAALKRRLPIAVAGVGMWGSFHCRLMKQADPNVDLYICGRNRERAERLANATGAKDVILGFERAAEDSRIEAIDIVLPHHLHVEATVQAAAGGKHVLVEKPIAITLADADTMIRAAQQARTILMVAEDMHFRPAIREAVRMIGAGDIGEPLYLLGHAGGVLRPRGWKADPTRMGGGILMDIGVHYVRAVRLLMGEPHDTMAGSAMQIDTKIKGEDSVQLLLRSRYGWQAQLLLSWAGPRGNAPDLIVCGDRGVLHLWPGRGHVDLYPAAPRPLTQILSCVRPAWLREKLVRPGLQRVRVRIPGDDRQGYLSEMREFIAAIAEGRPVIAPPEDARRDLEIVLRAYDALESGSWMPIS